MKLNFDGAPRGNPGKAWFGGIVRDHHGQIVHGYYDSKGETTNNEAEFAAMQRGIAILVRENMSNVIIEGDSMLAINAAKHIHNGAQVPKVTVHWRLAYVMSLISRHLRMPRGVEFTI